MFIITPGEIQGFADIRDTMERGIQDMLMALLNDIGMKTVADLRSLTSEMRPPVRAGEGSRQAHPGHWADITGQLALHYNWYVDPLVNGGAVLTVSNDMGYAEALEAKDGYFVLSGYMDPDGPVERILREAVAQLAPDWIVTRGQSDGE